MPASPLYPFGSGLSYTQFQYSNLRVSPGEIYKAGSSQVSVDVENTGHRAGVETLQVFVHHRCTPVGTSSRAPRRFDRIALDPGENKTVQLTLGPEDLQLLNQE